MDIKKLSRNELEKEMDSIKKQIKEYEDSIQKLKELRDTIENELDYRTLLYRMGKGSGN